MVAAAHDVEEEELQLDEHAAAVAKLHRDRRPRFHLLPLHGGWINDP